MTSARQFREVEQDEAMESQLPVHPREIPESWWELILNTGPWYISSKDFELPVDLAEFRGFFYRRAQTRRLHVATKIVKHTGRLYLQARPNHFYEDPADWTQARRAPAMHQLPQSRDRSDRYAVIGEAVVNLLRAQGFQVIEPGDYTPAAPEPTEEDVQLAPARKLSPLERLQQLPLPDGWAWSQFQPYQMLPPGVPDIKGAVYDSTDRHEIAALALEFQEMAAKCTCGADDLRYHQPSCAVTGG